MFLKGIAWGNLVEVHKIVSKYSLPDFDCGPAQSMKIILKDSSKAGIG